MTILHATFDGFRVSNCCWGGVGAGSGPEPGGAMASKGKRPRDRRTWGLAVVLAGFLAYAGLAAAQDGVAPPPPDAGQAAQPGQPSARAVRLSSVDGQVQLSQGNQILAAQALVNTP